MQRAVRTTEDLTETSQGAQVTHAGSGFREPQDVGGLAVREVLEVPHEEDFPIGLVHLVQSREELFPQFFPQGVSGRGQFGIHQLGDKFE